MEISSTGWLGFTGFAAAPPLLIAEEAEGRLHTVLISVQVCKAQLFSVDVYFLNQDLSNYFVSLNI